MADGGKLTDLANVRVRHYQFTNRRHPGTIEGQQRGRLGQYFVGMDTPQDKAEVNSQEESQKVVLIAGGDIGKGSYYKWCCTRAPQTEPRNVVSGTNLIDDTGETSPQHQQLGRCCPPRDTIVAGAAGQDSKSRCSWIAVGSSLSFIGSWCVRSDQLTLGSLGVCSGKTLV